MKINRREFIKNASLMLLFTAFFRPFKWLGTAYAANFKTPPPAGKNIADSAKGQAKNMKYVNFTSEYTGPKKDIFAQSKSNCTNCNYFKPDKAGDAWGKCAMVGNAYVYQEGLCQMWMKKPGA